MIKRVLISGGGTGGHIFPALSIANALRRRHPDIEILFVGADDRMEMTRVPAAGYEIKGLPVAGFDRKRLWRNIGVLLKLRRSMSMAKRIVREFKPDIAIGVGGYASGPTLKAAQKAGVPTLLQEQNSHPGVTNKLLAKRAKAICVAYEGLDRFFPARAISLTGNPVRKDLCECALTQEQAKERLGFDPSKPLALVVGGSLGARTVNLCVNDAAADIAAAGAQLLWQTGKNWRQKTDLPDGCKATDFISDMATAYRAADLVVSRAGAGTISELQLLGKPSILVPSPNVAEDHQRKNAQALADRGAALMVLDADARARLKDETLRLLADRPLRASLAERISRMAMPDSDEKIVDIIDDICK